MTTFEHTIADFKYVAEQVRRGIYKPPRLPDRYDESSTTITATDFAARVARAGQLRRGELKEEPQFTNDAAGDFARRCINAARKARGQEPI